MPKTKPSLNSKTLVAVVAKAAAGASRRKLAKLYPNAPERLLRAIGAAGIGVEEFERALAIETLSLSAETALSYRADLRAGRVPPHGKPIAVGIFADKAAQLGLRTPTSTLHLIDFPVGGMTRSDALALLRSPLTARLPEPKQIEPLLL